MMRKLAVVADYLDDSHRTHIEKMAGDAGFTVDYFTEGHLPQDRAGEYEVIYGTVPPKELKAATALRWFCCSYAGMDQWKDDALYHSPEVMLSNSSGAYGVTSSEHRVMVTLMLLRQMPTVQEWMRRHDWSNEKPPMRSVCGSRVTVLGTGDIGTSFARRVKAMGAKTVVGVSRSGRHVDDAYDAMYTLYAATKAAGVTADTSTEDACEMLVAAMKDLKINGVTGMTGEMTWNENGEVNKAPIVVKIVNGAYVTVE